MEPTDSKAWGLDKQMSQLSKGLIKSNIMDGMMEDLAILTIRILGVPEDRSNRYSRSSGDSVTHSA